MSDKNYIFKLIQKSDSVRIENLIEHNKDCLIYVNENGDSPLGYAAWLSKVEISELLLKSGSNVELINKEGRTAMHNAFEVGSTDIHNLLIQYGAVVDICIAAGMGNLNRINEILGATKTLVDESSTGLTPMEWAGYGNQGEAIELLVKYGADVNFRVIENGFTPLMPPAQVNGVNAASVMLKHGADPNLFDRKKCTPLHHAAAMAFTTDSSDVIRLLLENNADPNLENIRGQTPIGMAEFFRLKEDHDHPSAPNQKTKKWDKVISLIKEFGGK